MTPEDARHYQLALEYRRYHDDEDCDESMLHHKAGMEVAWLQDLEEEQ